MSSIAVVMVGGPSTSNFRALGSVPAPLFPIAGRALLHHPITAAAAVPGITAVFVLGFYEEREFALYLSSMSAEIGVPVRYLCESRGHGSAGGLHQFRAALMEENPAAIFLLNCDVCCAFPLAGTALARVARRAAVCAGPRGGALGSPTAPLGARVRGGGCGGAGMGGGALQGVGVVAARRGARSAGAARNAAAAGGPRRAAPPRRCASAPRPPPRRSGAARAPVLRLPSAFPSLSAPRPARRPSCAAAAGSRAVGARSDAPAPRASRRPAGGAPAAPLRAGDSAGEARHRLQGVQLRRGGG
jgi:hypothetical protein